MGNTANKESEEEREKDSEGTAPKLFQGNNCTTLDIVMTQRDGDKLLKHAAKPSNTNGDLEGESMQDLIERFKETQQRIANYNGSKEDKNWKIEIAMQVREDREKIARQQQVHELNKTIEFLENKKTKLTKKQRRAMKKNAPVPHIVCISCPASKDYSTFFHKLLINAYKRNRPKTKPSTKSTKKKNKKKNRNNKNNSQNKPENPFSFTFDTIVLNNDTLDPATFDKQIAKATTILISGSSNSAYDDAPWIHYLKETIVKAHQRDIKLVGICFGHQIIAQALGGNVIANPNGDEKGVATFTPTQEAITYLSSIINNNNNNSNSNITNTITTLSLFCWHGDVVMELPDDCECGGSNTNTENQFYYNGKNILCFQSHPEFNIEWIQKLNSKYYKSSDAEKYQLIASQVRELNETVRKDAAFVNDAIYCFCTTSSRS